MSWVSIGPNFVFDPIDRVFNRLSRRNERGKQALVSAIVVDPVEPEHIYIVVRPATPGAAAFRTDDGGASWSPISDALQKADPLVAPSAIAVNPLVPSTIYLATDDGRCFVSSNRGEPGSWSPASTLGGTGFGPVRTLLVDPNTAADPTTTVVYAGGGYGVFQSDPGVSSWSQILSSNPGTPYPDVWSLIGDFSVAGETTLYAGVRQSGVFMTSNPASGWTNLGSSNLGLPVPADVVLLGRCPANGRLYALYAQQSTESVTGIYTSASPTSAWSAVKLPSSMPGIAYGLYDLSFAVAPNSPGDGVNDVLFFGAIDLWRSIDSGRSWVTTATDFHEDHHSCAFFPDGYQANQVPVMFFGCDGGIARSDRFADPAFDFAQSFKYFDERLAYSDTGSPENLNHALPSVACLGYGADPNLPALSYLGSHDTGLAAGAYGLGWRSLENADGNQVAASFGPNGMSVWNAIGLYPPWAVAQVHHWIDRGDFSSSPTTVRMAAAAGSVVMPESNFAVGLDGLCLAGLTARSPQTTLSLAITTTGTQTAHAVSLAGVVEGASLIVDSELVVATAITPTTFSATFNQTHLAGAPIVLERHVVGRIDHSAQATQISQDFGPNQPAWVAQSPVDADKLYCATVPDNRLWTTANGSAAGANTVWTELPSGLTGSFPISSFTVDQAGDVYVLLLSPITVGNGAAAFATPLFKVAPGAWTGIPSTGLPANIGRHFYLGKIVADPVQAAQLYATFGPSVFQIAVSMAASAAWSDLSDGLPGSVVSDLWAASVPDRRNPGLPPVTLLRAAVPTRGVWELALAESATAERLYLRDNLADLGWISSYDDGARDPYLAYAQLWHYQCADIKIDARNPGSSSVPPFFQTDPESSTLPISQVIFDQLNDNSRNLPAGDAAMIHVQAHNRSTTPANGVQVWAIVCNASAGAPAIPASFWNQFQANGSIIASAPSGWTSIGEPVTLQAIDAAHPRVASWHWTIPAPSTNAEGHFCVLAFVHSAHSSLSLLTATSADDAVAQSGQVGQKNVHIGAPFHLGSGPTKPGSWSLGEVIEFHNTSANRRLANLVFDFRGLHRNLRPMVFFTPLDTASPMIDAVSGFTKPMIVEGGDRPGEDSCARFGLGHERDPDDAPGIALPGEFERTGWIAQRSAILQVSRVRLAPLGHVKAMIFLQAAGPLPPGRRLRFEVQQTVDGRLVGGSTYIVPIAGSQRLPPPAETSEDDDEIDDSASYMQSWLRDAWLARKKQQGKT